MISVVVPCYNQGRFLDSCLTSIKRSTYNDIEVVIVNDGSTEPLTQQLLQTVHADHPELKIKVINQVNGGLSNARNNGITAATGEFVQLLDCDDMISKNKFELQIGHFGAAPEKSCVISDYYFVSEDGNIDTLPQPSIKGHEFSTVSFLTLWEKQLSIPIHCALFRKELFEKVQFLPSFRAKEDWIFWTTLSSMIGPTGFLYHEDRCAIYRLNSGSMTKNADLMLLDWVRAQTFLLAKFGHLFKEDELLVELKKNADHIAKNYLQQIKQKNNELPKLSQLRTMELVVLILQKKPTLYKFLRSFFRMFKRLAN